MASRFAGEIYVSRRFEELYGKTGRVVFVVLVVQRLYSENVACKEFQALRRVS